MSHEPPAGGPPDWYTPPEVFQALGLRFDLDPCAPPPPQAAWIPAEARYCLPVDGLARPWFGRVWLNPPYATQTARWIGKLADHGDGIALTFVRSDTPWWQAAAARASAVCFISGRVNFIDGTGARRQRSRAGAPSCLLAFGIECGQAVIGSGLGACGVFVAPERLELRVGHGVPPFEDSW